MPKMSPKALPQILNCKTICLRISSCAVCAHKQKVLACLWRIASSFLHFEGKKVITWQLLNPSLCTILRVDTNMVCWHRPGGGCGRQTPRMFRVLWNSDQLFGTRLWKQRSSRCETRVRLDAGWSWVQFLCWEGLWVGTTKFLHCRLDLLSLIICSEIT